MDPVWIAVGAVIISALTLVGNQIRIRRVERGEYVDSISNQLSLVRESLRDAKRDYEECRRRCEVLENKVRDCETERQELVKQNLDLSIQIRDLLSDYKKPRRND